MDQIATIVPLETEIGVECLRVKGTVGGVGPDLGPAEFGQGLLGAHGLRMRGMRIALESEQPGAVSDDSFGCGAMLAKNAHVQ